MKLKADRESRMKEMEDEVKESLAQSIRPRVNLPQNRTEYDSWSVLCMSFASASRGAE